MAPNVHDSDSNAPSTTDVLATAWDQIERWTPNQPNWQREALRRIAGDEDVLSSAGIESLADLVVQDLLVPGNSPPTASQGPEGIAPPIAPTPPARLTLERISDVVGVNAMMPKEPLTFGSQLSVVYGENGSGKSGYVRILRQFGRARFVAPIRQNVFGAPLEPKARIGYVVGSDTRFYDWTGATNASCAPDELKNVHVFDSDCAKNYLSKKNELFFKPKPLEVLGQLSKACDAAREEAVARNPAGIPWRSAVPEDVKVVPRIVAVVKARRLQTDEQLDDLLAWDEKAQNRLAELELVLASVSPEEDAKRLGREIARTTQLSASLKAAADLLSPAGFEALVGLRRSADEAQRAAEQDARLAFDDRQLSGIAADSWRRLWLAARDFSTQAAYPSQPFPVTGENAKCPLCQQPLSDEASARFRHFEDYVAGKLQVEAKAAAERLANQESQLRSMLSEPVVAGHLDGSGIDSGLRAAVEAYCRQLRDIRDAFLGAEGGSQLPLPEDPLAAIDAHVKDLQKRQADCMLAVSSDDRPARVTEAADLRARRWFAARRQEWDGWRQQDTILQRLDKITDTAPITRLVGRLSELLLTNSFVERFNTELGHLGAKGLKVVLDLDAGKAKAAHQVVLQTKVKEAKAADILSEGEMRVVALAAFLTEAQMSPTAPIVLDDPVSSLDQRFEECAAERIVELARTRQVVVFTHRISLTVLLNDWAKQQAVSCTTTAVARAEWGTGEPECNPLSTQKCDAAITTLRNNRLAALRTSRAVSNEEFERHASQLTKDIRITLERIVERHLLNGIVQRFRRSVQTMGRLKSLPRVTTEDCCLIDSLMTRYSRHEHSQSDELPIPPVDPDLIEKDLAELQEWLTAFKKKMEN